MRIHCTTKFLDGRVQFEQDDICTVSDEDGARFIANGWAVREGGGDAPAQPSDAVTLDIQSGSHSTKAVTHG